MLTPPEDLKKEEPKKEEPKAESKWASFANNAGWEKAIGKSLMGIFASVLIFISLILFATLLLPYFNDTAKMITTYVISFAFLGAGIYSKYSLRSATSFSFVKVSDNLS